LPDQEVHRPGARPSTACPTGERRLRRWPAALV